MSLTVKDISLNWESEKAKRQGAGKAKTQRIRPVIK